MKASIGIPIFFMLGLFAMAGCEVTEEKIELWKGTQNGPKKLAGTVIDPEVPIDLRAKAVVALMEINSWEMFRDSFKKMKKADAHKVVEAVVPTLAKIVEGGGGAQDKQVVKEHIDAKDALFIMLDYADGKGKAGAERALIRWCTDDYNKRAMAGQYNIKTIVKKIGPAAGDALVSLLAVDQVVIKHVAELIREVGDPTVLVKASEQLANELKDNLSKVAEVHLVSAAIIGGEPIGNVLLNFATDKGVSAGLQRFSLRAFSEGLNTGAIKLSDAQVGVLFSMAENSEYDRYQREETYYVIAQGARKKDLTQVRRLLSEKGSFWRAIGLKCILRMDGEGQLGGALQEIGRLKLAKSRNEINEIIDRVVSFPKLLPKVRELLDNSSSFVKAIAINVLKKIGTAEDAGRIAKLVNDKTRLPKGFEQKTLGGAAQAAIEAIKKRG